MAHCPSPRSREHTGGYGEGSARARCSRAREHATPIFVVGSPRSGTTLVQTLLAAHPNVVSCPETHFFVKIAAAGWRRRLGLPSVTAPTALDSLVALGLLDRERRATLRPVTTKQYVHVLTSALDELARSANASHWVEKTPNHVRYLDLIDRYVPRARIVHVIRAGEAVVASLRDVKTEHPDVWKGSNALLDLVSEWRRDLRLSAARIGQPSHCFVSYEHLVERPAEVLTSLCRALGLPIDVGQAAAMLARHGAGADSLIGYARFTGSTEFELANEPWKRDVGQPLSNRNPVKFRAIFTDEEQEVIRHEVAKEDAAMRAFPWV